jgi:hypothetical protein
MSHHSCKKRGRSFSDRHNADRFLNYLGAMNLSG